MSDETIYHVTFNDDDRETYVLASDEWQAHVVLRRKFDYSEYDFDWEDYSIEDIGHNDIERAARGSTPPYEVLRARKYVIAEHQKRVNQNGYKGMYIVTYAR